MTLAFFSTIKLSNWRWVCKSI